MSSRLAGAILALTAAALLALSLVTSAWWAGHPIVDGRSIELKTVHVGLHGAEGCNTGGDGACTSLDMPGGFTATGYVGLAVTGLLVLGAILLGVSTLKSAEGRKTLAKLVLGLVGAAALVAIVLIVQGPKMSGSARQISIPVGYGMILFWIGNVVGIAGAILAMRPIPMPALRPSRAAFAPGLEPPPPASQHVDMMAPMMPRAVAPPAGAALAGPAGPLGPGSGQPAPMFGAAPGLRPLYDADPNVGGSGGYVGHAQPPMPARAPTPMPLANVAEMFGGPAAAPFAPPPAAPPAPSPFAPPTPPAPPPFAPPAAPPPAPPPFAPPPAPARATSMGPAVGALPPLPTKVPTIPPPLPTKVPTIPPINRARPQSVPPPPGSIAARLKASSVPPPLRTAAPAPLSTRTLAGAVVPPPPATFQLPTRAVTDPGDLGETIDREAAQQTLPREKEADVQIGRPATHGEVGDSTDASMPLPEAESTDVRAPIDTEEAPVVPPPAENDDAETNAIEKQTLDDTGVSEKVEPVAAASPAPSEAPKIPISTAPDSLPPPTEKQAATSGPSPACPQCEAPMAWVEEHLRFYCKSCRMYF